MKKYLIPMSLFLVACGSSQPADTTAAEPATPAPLEVESKEAPASGPSAASAELGQPAPAFSLKDVDGNEVSLSQLQGKTVVLEWFNPGCPFIKYAHSEGPLKALSEGMTGGGQVTWLAINSGAAGKPGAGVELNKSAMTDWSMSYPVLLDESGEVGQAYGAKATPHMFVIDPQGNLAYRGALDNAPRGNAEGDYVNYVEKALADLQAGRPVETAETKAYGCSVKY
jgi:peroxiredoxin